jgi:CDGSH-type Zn-finger protein
MTGSLSNGKGAGTAEYDPGAYGRAVAADYDRLYEAAPETAEAVQLLAELAGDGAVLEMGIGTGRLALPLLMRGVEVAGIEGSAEMLDQLRAKAGGARISTRRATMALWRCGRSRISPFCDGTHKTTGFVTREGGGR